MCGRRALEVTISHFSFSCFLDFIWMCSHVFPNSGKFCQAARWRNMLGQSCWDHWQFHGWWCPSAAVEHQCQRVASTLQHSLTKRSHRRTADHRAFHTNIKKRQGWLIVTATLVAQDNSKWCTLHPKKLVALLDLLSLLFSQSSRTASSHQYGVAGGATVCTKRKQ